MSRAEKLITGATRLPGYSGTWRRVRFGEIAAIRNDKVHSTGLPAATRCVALEHIHSGGTGRLQGWSHASESNATGYRFFAGDVLFGRLRPYLRKYWRADWSGMCTTEIWPLVPAQPRVTTSAYLMALVQTAAFFNGAAVTYGTHMPRADWAVVERLEFALPPVAEQRAITAVLTDVDAEIAALERLLVKARAIKLATMQQLLTGRTRLPGFPERERERGRERERERFRIVQLILVFLISVTKKGLIT